MRCISSPLPLPNIYEVARDCGRRRHRRTHQMRAAALALTPLEVAIRRARASLAGLQHVGIHRQAHAASRLAPFESSFGENPVETETLRLGFHFLRARHYHRMNRRRDLV